MDDNSVYTSKCCDASVHQELGFEAWFTVCDKCDQECLLIKKELPRVLS